LITTLSISSEVMAKVYFSTINYDAKLGQTCSSFAGVNVAAGVALTTLVSVR
jgi:hypothetical protein